MQFSVGQYTTVHLPFAQDLAAYREGGAEGIGIDQALKLRDPAGDLREFKESGLVATFCFPTTSTVFAGSLSHGSTDPVTRIEEMCEGIRTLAAFDPVCCVCGTGPTGGRDPKEAWDIAASGLKQVARYAADLGLKLALEPMHASMSAEWSFLTNLSDAGALLEQIDEPNVGLVLDIWHLWDTPDLLPAIRSHPERIFGVHVNDWRDPTRSWCDRVLPGDGVAAVGTILGTLKGSGYDGWLELEIFSDDGSYGNDFNDSLWKRDPVELIRDGYEHTVHAWTEAS